MIIRRRYFPWCVLLLMVVVSTVTMAQNVKEQDLIAVLKSDAPKGEKAITCKKMAIYGTDQSVPVLVPLLGDKALSSWARIALEAIPGPVADAALRNAVGTVKGRLLIGVINSIAVRRDAQAVDVLIGTLDDTDVGVACAAAVALGHLGGDQAAKTLMKSLADTRPDVRSAAAQGCILCAEQCMTDDRAAAVTLYDSVRQANVPDQRHGEAIRGAILARRFKGVPLLIEQLKSDDQKRLSIGLRAARELGGRRVTEALAGEMAELSPERRPLLLLALSDRSDPAVLPIVLKAAASPSQDMRATAIEVLVRIGNVSCVSVLLETATGRDPKLQQAATETIIRLPDNAVDADVVARLATAQGNLRCVLIKVAGQRQIAASLPVVVSSLKDGNAEIRSAAVRTVGIIGQVAQARDFVALLQDTSNASERVAIKIALLAICGREGAACLSYVKPLTLSRDSELHVIGLNALSIIGGPEALGAVTSAMTNDEVSVTEEAIRILSTWPNKWPEDTEAGRHLLGLAMSAEKMSHHVLAMRGYLQYVRGSKALNRDQKVTAVESVLDHTKRPEEKRQAIAVLSETPTASALGLLVTLAKDAALAEEAYSAMVVVAARDMAGVSKDRRKQILQTVSDESKNNRTKQRARATLGRIR
ncbi:MAG: HEAT repeat domain-containing protein [Planctomycetes bacterium]|nr:HEAT repeat domain-containing protein [Planctomycetota bacterium]